MIDALRFKIVNYAKNLYGWTTNRKIIVFSVDDYGNVRLDSKKARENLDSFGMKSYSRFDEFDTLETTQDLEALFEVLSSVKDANGKSAVFTPFSLTCNIDFESMKSTGYQNYVYETLPKTFEKMESYYPELYTGTWKLWKEGISKGLLVPQFHGREHINLTVFNKKLKVKDKQFLYALENRSYASINDNEYPTLNYPAAFDFWDVSENYSFESIIKEGLSVFEKIFGYKAEHFTSPANGESPILHKYLKDSGIKFIDNQYMKNEHQGKGVYKKIINYNGKKNNLGMSYIIRNVVFEPTGNQDSDVVSNTLSQIAIAFKMNKPAIISSHRVNFCGNIDEKNREKGLLDLKLLLSEIVKRWPDVEFMSSNQLGNLMIGN